MDTAKFLTTMQAAGPSAATNTKTTASDGFAWLSKNRQRLVFETIQEGLSAIPQRPEASFENVVKAYISLSRVVNIASNGQLSDHDLCSLETDIQAAGGVIAPGLCAEGENSLASFRSATFGLLDRAFAPAVSTAIQIALNAQLQKQKHQDIGEVFQEIANFLSPLTHAPGNNPTLDTFLEFDNDRKCNVFKTLRDSIAANPPRPDANFSSVVTAFQAELSVLKKASQGQLTDDLLSHLQSSVRLAGGKLCPNLYSEGENSIETFRESTFRILYQTLAPEVAASVISALNVAISKVNIQDIASLYAETKSFLRPILPGSWDTPASKDLRNLDARRQALVFRTLELQLSSQQNKSAKLFDYIVRAFTLERLTIDQACQGVLTVESLQNLCQAVEQCGGFLASGLTALGKGSLAEFIDSHLLQLRAKLPVDVFDALLNALNAKLRTTSIQNVDDITVAIDQFLAPVQAGITSNSQGPDELEASRSTAEPMGPELQQSPESYSSEAADQHHFDSEPEPRPKQPIDQHSSSFTEGVAKTEISNNNAGIDPLQNTIPISPDISSSETIGPDIRAAAFDASSEHSLEAAHYRGSADVAVDQTEQLSDDQSSSNERLIHRDESSTQGLNSDAISPTHQNSGLADSNEYSLPEAIDKDKDIDPSTEAPQQAQHANASEPKFLEPATFYPEVNSQSLIFEVPPDSESAKKKHSAA